MSRSYRQGQTPHQTPARSDTWREVSGSVHITPTHPQTGYLSPMAPPMAYSSSTDSNQSVSSPYSPSSAYISNMALRHSPQNPHMYDTFEYDPRTVMQGQFEALPSSSNHDYLLDGQDTAGFSHNPRPTTVERSNHRFVCLHDHCEASFSRVADLNRHQKSIHFPTRVDCPKPFCNRTGFFGFTREDHLTEHLRQYHGENLAKRTSSKSKRTEAK